jgi:hypothetical protein
MRRFRPIVNAMLVTFVLRPMVRRSLARWTRGVRGSAEATIIIPARELLEGALPVRLEVEPAPLSLSSGTVDGVSGRRILGPVLLVVAVATIAMVSALAIAALRRRRRAGAMLAPAGTREPVAVPIEVPSVEAKSGDWLATEPAEAAGSGQTAVAAGADDLPE